MPFTDNATNIVAVQFAEQSATPVPDPPAGYLKLFAQEGKFYLYTSDGDVKRILTHLPVIELPPAVPSALDDEFETTTLDGKWTVFATDADITYTVSGGYLHIVDNSAAGPSLHGIYQAAPTAPYDIQAKILWSQDSLGIGILLQQSSDDYAVLWAYHPPTKQVDYISIAPTMMDNDYGPVTDLEQLYLRVVDDSTNRKFYYSLNGVIWSLFGTVSNTDIVTPDRIGIGFIANSTVAEYAVEWFRSL